MYPGIPNPLMGCNHRYAILTSEYCTGIATLFTSGTLGNYAELETVEYRRVS